jgi:hypothetical protein
LKEKVEQPVVVSGVQRFAFDRTVPILPMYEGRIERRSHNYYRHGTRTLFAALGIATAQVTAALGAAPPSGVPGAREADRADLTALVVNADGAPVKLRWRRTTTPRKA